MSQQKGREVSDNISPSSTHRGAETPSVVEELHRCVRQDTQMLQTKYFRPSSICGCKREAYYHFLKFPTEPQQFDPRFQLILNTGTKLHDLVQSWLARSQRYFVASEVHVWVPLLHVFGHPDTVLIDRQSGEKLLVEFKSINSTGYARLTKAKHEHKRQANTYAGLLGIAWYTVVYINKDTSDMREFKYPYDDDLFDEAMLWCDEVRQLASNRQLPPFVKSACNEMFCRFVGRCRDERAAALQAKVLQC